MKDSQGDNRNNQKEKGAEAAREPEANKGKIKRGKSEIIPNFNES